jgi:hypothetical protein
MTTKPRSLEDAKRLAHQRSILFRNVFGSHDGKLVLEILRETFYDNDLMSETSERTAYNLGRREDNRNAE